MRRVVSRRLTRQMSGFIVRPMHKSQILQYFKTVTAAAKAIGVSRQAFYDWPELIPEQWAWTVEGKTRGALKVNERLYEDAA